MSGALRKLQYLRNKLTFRKPEPGEITEEKWTADFSKEKNARFDIKSESAYDANLRKNLFNSAFALVLSLKKAGCIAWVEAPEHSYRDMVLSGAVRVDPRGGYGAAGVLFRMVDDKTYYSFLISSKGYFRLDVVRNGMPFPLVGWTEIPLFTGTALAPDQSVDFSVIAYGSHIVLLVRGRWAAEISDSSIAEGTVCFTAASYESGDPTYRVIKNDLDVSYTTEAFLESFTIDSRISEISSLYEKWSGDTAASDIDPKARLNLAETFTAMAQYSAAMVQLNKSWDTPGHRKTQRELLLAGRLAQQLGLMTDAEKYISQCFETNVDSPEGKEAVTEMTKILYAEKRFKELKDYCAEALKLQSGNPVLWTFQGHAHWNLAEYKHAALAYDRAAALDRENGILAKNAANVYEVMGRKKEALPRYLDAGRAFLKDGSYNDLGLLVPKLLSLGEDNWEGRSLAGKWAFAVEDWNMAEAEFKRAEELRKAKRPKPPKDGAQVLLEALLLIRAGKRREALPLLKEAAALGKNYPLFHFRLAENIFLLDDDPDDPVMLKEMNEALSLSEDKPPEGDTPEEDLERKNLSGWIHNFAAQVALRKGDMDSAAKHLEKAADILGDVPAVRVNRGVLFFLNGFLNKALEVLSGKILSGENRDDPEGVMANCAGNLLVRSGRFEEADEKYRLALAAAPDNVEYLSNRASCLMELGLYGEADTLLLRAHTIAPAPALLEMIAYVAAKKGEYARAEQACRSALEMDPNHAPSLLSLAWTLLTLGRQEEAKETLRRLDNLELREDAAKSREELRLRLDEVLYLTIECAVCDRNWKVPRDPPPAPAIRLFAMPPDTLPAGSCQTCGKTYCIGCAKKNIDPKGRFLCPTCNQPLKLVNEGIKKIIYEWAVKDGLLKKNEKGGAKKRGPGRPRKES